jgi:DNA polymerase-3 subunit gamma/tau
LRELNELARHGKDLGRLLSDLLSHFRNLLIYLVSKGDMSLLEVSEAEAASLAEQAQSASPQALTRIMEVLTDCETRLRDAASKKILIEVALLQAIEARSATSIDTVLKQLQQLRAVSGPEVATIPVPAPAHAPAVPVDAPAPVRGADRAFELPEVPQPAGATVTSAVATAATDAMGADDDLGQLWHKILDAVGRASPFTRSYLLEAHPVSFGKDLLTIGFDPEFADHLELVDNAKSRTVIQTKLSEFGFPNAQVRFVKGELPRKHVVSVLPAPEPAPQPPSAGATVDPGNVSKATAPPPTSAKLGSAPCNKDEFKNDPLIRKAVEIFKGQIVEVRA